MHAWPKHYHLGMLADTSQNLVFLGKTFYGWLSVHSLLIWSLFFISV